MKKITFITLLSIWSVSGWLWGASPESYMPLTEGMVWEFQHKFLDLKTKAQIGEAKSIKDNLPPVELQGIRVVPQVFSFYQPANNLKQKTKTFIGQDSSGFYVVARQSLNEEKPNFIAEKFYILKFPLTKGASWIQSTEGMISHNTIESSDATVEVPAGIFKNCILVKRLFFKQSDPQNAIQETTFWFAPHVGNIKVVTKNPSENKEIIQELVSFKK